MQTIVERVLANEHVDPIEMPWERERFWNDFPFAYLTYDGTIEHYVERFMQRTPPGVIVRDTVRSYGFGVRYAQYLYPLSVPARFERFEKYEHIFSMAFVPVHYADLVKRLIDPTPRTEAEILLIVRALIRFFGQRMPIFKRLWKISPPDYYAMLRKIIFMFRDIEKNFYWRGNTAHRARELFSLSLAENSAPLIQMLWDSGRDKTGWNITASDWTDHQAMIWESTESFSVAFFAKFSTRQLLWIPDWRAQSPQQKQKLVYCTKQIAKLRKFQRERLALLWHATSMRRGDVPALPRETILIVESFFGKNPYLEWDKISQLIQFVMQRDTAWQQKGAVCTRKRGKRGENSIR